MPHLATTTRLALGYGLCILIGWVLLLLPWSQHASVSWLDHLYVATSAVSTTGLAPVSVAETYTWFGQGVLLVLFQIGGLGYMTFVSVIALNLTRHPSQARNEELEADFPHPDELGTLAFSRLILRYTFLVEVLGAGLLYVFFAQANVEAPLWRAVFHSVSAFCTAGFSTFPDSFQSFQGHVGINATIALLSYLGGLGFIVAQDVYLRLRRRSQTLTLASRLILKVMLLVSVIGTGLLLLEADLRTRPWPEHVLTAFFQAMTAHTTVGFNTVDVGVFSTGGLVALIGLMVLGASPSGTGGGLKSLNLAILFATVRGALQPEKGMHLGGHRLSAEALHCATATLCLYVLLLAVGTYLGAMLVDAPFSAIVFETVSALGTVGLSTGLTGDLTAAAQGLFIVLMLAGRLGPLTFGAALLGTEPEEGDSAEELDSHP